MWSKELRPDQVTKSNLIVGMGETEQEVYGAMRDLRTAGCDVLTIGQYLQPSVSWHLPVDRWVHPEEFARFKEFGETELDFAWVESGPLVRSSYHAGKQYRSALASRPRRGGLLTAAIASRPAWHAGLRQPTGGSAVETAYSPRPPRGKQQRYALVHKWRLGAFRTRVTGSMTIAKRPQSAA